jgi:hypothetical protein
MSDAPSIGGMRLYDAAIPDLTPGLYRIISGLNIAEGSVSLAAPADQHSFFRVIAPRFTLASGDISECFPPSGSKGAFGNNLPHISLGRRTLPWERRIDRNDTAASAPWLALLVLRADEAEFASATVRTGLPAAVVSKLETHELIDGDPPVTLLKVKELETFRAIFPSRRETALLAHVRQVNLADSVLAGDDDDGWFAILTSNRLPIAVGSEPETAYVACLVSLEARDDIWTVQDGQAPPPLILLHSWPFTTTTEGGTFEQIASRLDAAPFGGGEGDNAVVDTLGRLTVEHHDHDGNSATAYYRGPMIGVSDEDIPSDSDDISLAAAEEIGRMLGIADGRFLRELVEWHRKSEAVIRASLEANEMKTMINFNGLINTVAQLQDLLLEEVDRSRISVANIGRLTSPRNVP